VKIGPIEGTLVVANVAVLHVLKGDTPNQEKVQISCYRNLREWLPGIGMGTWIFYLRRDAGHLRPVDDFAFAAGIDPRAVGLVKKASALTLLVKTVELGNKDFVLGALEVMGRKKDIPGLVDALSKLVEKSGEGTYIHALGLLYLVKLEKYRYLEDAIAFAETSHGERRLVNIASDISVAIRGVRERRVLAVLNEVLVKPDSRLTRDVAHAVACMADRSSERGLLQCLRRSEDVRVRYDCLAGLYRIQRVVGPGFTAFTKDPDKWVEVIAKRCESQRERETNVRSPAAALEDGTGQMVRHGAEVGRSKVGSMIENLGSRDDEVRSEAIDALSAVGAPAVRELLVSLNSEDKRKRHGVNLTLTKIGAAAVPELVARLEERDWRIRMNVAEILGAIGPGAKDAVLPLAEALEDERDEVRKYAARSLGKIGPAARDAVPALKRSLNDRDRLVRGHASNALRRILGEKSVDATELKE